MPRTGRPKTSEAYALQVAQLVEDGGNRTIRDITETIEASARAHGDVDWPSEATVRRLVKQHREQAPAMQRLEAPFHWPQAMVDGLLPWEAAPPALELLAWMDTHGLGRPTVRLAAWFWRISLAATDLPAQERHELAAKYAVWEYARTTGGRFEFSGGHEWEIAYAPWRSPEAAQSYQAALSRAQDPIPARPFVSRGQGDSVWHYLRNLVGVQTADDLRQTIAESTGDIAITDRQRGGVTMSGTTSLAVKRRGEDDYVEVQG